MYHVISLFFDIPLLHFYINLRSLIISSLFSGNIYLSLNIFLSLVTELLCGAVFETLVILPGISLAIKLPVASAVFWTALFEAI